MCMQGWEELLAAIFAEKLSQNESLGHGDRGWSLGASWPSLTLADPQSTLPCVNLLTWAKKLSWMKCHSRLRKGRDMGGRWFARLLPQGVQRQHESERHLRK